MTPSREQVQRQVRYSSAELYSAVLQLKSDEELLNELILRILDAMLAQYNLGVLDGRDDRGLR